MTIETLNARADEIKSELAFLAMECRIAVNAVKSIRTRMEARREVLEHVQKQSREMARKGGQS